MAASNCLAQPRKLSPVTSKKESDQPPRPSWVSIRRTADMKVSLSPHHVLSSAVFRLRRFKTKLVRGSYNRKEGTKHVPQKKTTHKNPTLADQHLLNWFIFILQNVKLLFCVEKPKMVIWSCQAGQRLVSTIDFPRLKESWSSCYTHLLGISFRWSKHHYRCN